MSPGPAGAGCSSEDGIVWLVTLYVSPPPPTSLLLAMAWGASLDICICLVPRHQVCLPASRAIPFQASRFPIWPPVDTLRGFGLGCRVAGDVHRGNATWGEGGSEVAEKSGRRGVSGESPLPSVSMSDRECGSMEDEVRHSCILKVKILGNNSEGTEALCDEDPGTASQSTI